MERVTGIGGIFFKAQNAQRLAAWYHQHLGIAAADGHTHFEWREKDRPDRVGHTVWSLFPTDTEYFGPGTKSFMLNYRVANLDRMLAQLREAGVTVEKTEDHPYGRFAWIVDPEGNRVELWEPKEEQK
jgi:predicted enzyme related to lactoylglutathione lyase